LLSGKAALLIGWADDFRLARQKSQNVAYVTPREGVMLWSENYVIPVASRAKATAELFINFLLRPEISAEISNHNDYATANQAALPHVRKDLRDDPAIYPPPDVLKTAHFLVPLRPPAQRTLDELWSRYMSGNQVR
jgi:spermidine/putrescine-binding protein